MLEDLKKWIIDVAREFVNGSTAGAGEVCDDTVKIAGQACDGTLKAAHDFKKELFENI